MIPWRWSLLFPHSSSARTPSAQLIRLNFDRSSGLLNPPSFGYKAQRALPGASLCSAR